MKYIHSRVERIEAVIRDKTSGCTMTFMNAHGAVLAKVRIPGKDNIAFVHDLDDDTNAAPVPM